MIRLVVVFLLLACVPAAGSLRINEIMASNGSTVADEDGDFSDWIEIHNAGAEAVDLEGFGLSDDPGRPFKWVFGPLVVDPGAHLLVWASGKNRQAGAPVPGLLREVYRNIPGGAVNDLLASPKFPDSPDEVSLLRALVETPPNDGDNYGQRLSGWLEVPTTGGYRFWISSDDQSRLYLSTDDSPANKQEIARVPQWTNAREWDKYPEQQSGVINLVAGRRYYMEVLMKEGVFGDNLAVGWTKPDNSLERPMAATHFIAGFSQPHTGFSLSSGGETVILTAPDGTEVDRLPPVALPRDISYGRAADDPEVLVYFDAPTPGAVNAGNGYASIVTERPQFSRDGGFYTEEFDLQIQSAAPGATILYTLDGSVPQAADLDGRTYNYKNQFPRNPGNTVGPLLQATLQTSVWSGSPLTIRDRSGETNRLSARTTTFDANASAYAPDSPVFKGTVVRARVVAEGALPGPVVTHTYFVTPAGAQRYQLPVISLSMDEDTLFDYERGLYTAGKDFDDWRAVSNDQAGGFSPANYNRRGDTAEYPLHMELFDPAAGRVVSQNLGFRIHGGWSRQYPQKTLRLYASTAYDDKDRVEYPLIAGLTQNRTGEPLASFRRFLLRNSGNDHARSRINDAFIQQLVRPMGLDHQGYQPAVQFINGEYWGTINIRERVDRFFIASHHDIAPGDVAILEHSGGLKEGGAEDASDFLALRDFIATQNMADPANYAQVTAQMDVDNFIRYKVAQIYANNKDWPHNNIEYWRSRAPDGEGTNDGRWRWILFDLDYGFGLLPSDPPTDNTLAHAINFAGTLDWSRIKLRQLLQNEEFRRKFINTFADQMATTFLPSRVNALADEMAAVIGPSMDEHVARWRHHGDRTVNHIKAFGQARPAVMRQHLMSRFGTGPEVNLTVDVNNPEQGTVTVNSITIDDSTPGAGAEPYPWTGTYFQGVPVTVTAVPKPGYRFVSWTDSAADSGDGVVWVTPDPPVAGQSVTVRYNPAGRPLQNAGQVYLHYAVNNWDNRVVPRPAMSNVAGQWQYTFTLPGNAEVLRMVFTATPEGNDSGPWDNNGGADWNIPVTAGVQTLASDAASNYGSWTNGANGGTGFGPWSLNTSTGDSGKAGTFLDNDRGGWGMYANDNEAVWVYRSLSNALQVGQTFTARVKHGSVSSPGEVGFELANSGGDALFKLARPHWSSTYRINGSATDIPVSTDPLDIEVTLVSSNSYSARITAAGVTHTNTGTLSENGDRVVQRFTAFNYSAGSGDEGDVFITSMQVTAEASSGGGGQEAFFSTNATISPSLAGATALRATFARETASELSIESAAVVQAGQTLPDITVRALTDSGETDTEYAGDVTLLVTGADGFAETYTLTMVAGVAVFSGVTVPGAGSYSLSAVSGELATATASDLTAELRRAVHFWNFNNSANLLGPSETSGGASLTISPGPATTVETGTGQSFADAHLRVNNPLGASMTLALPTTGFERIRFEFETRRSGQGAGTQVVSYTLDGGTFIEKEVYAVLDAAPQRRSFDFTGIAGAANNPLFAIRVEFAQGNGGEAGNNRFDNITLSGTAMPGPPVVQLEARPTGPLVAGSPLQTDLYEVFRDEDSPSLVFTATSSQTTVAAVSLAGGQLTITPLAPGETTITLTADDGEYDPVSTTFMVLVYPAAHELTAGPFAFEEWSADEAAMTYPANMIFLQSELNDPGLTADLPRAYQIPLDDASASIDAEQPYNATARTRINGLGNDGVAFINTGRGRDVGAALAAVDTTLAEAVTVSFTAGTVTPNFRVYAIRLQYRVGTEGPFLDVLSGGGQPVEYVRNATSGHTASFGPVTLPEDALGEPYVQLLWRYYFVSGSGARAQLRLDDISVAAVREGAATQLVLDTAQPVWVQDGITLAPVTVRAVNDDGLTDSAFNGMVTISLNGQGTLAGTVSVQAQNGVAVFDDLVVSGAGGTFSLQASSGAFAMAQTAGFSLSDVPVLLPGGDTDWTTGANWTSGSVPDGTGARAMIPAPAAGARNVNMRAPVTIGHLRFDNAVSAERNRLRDRSSNNTLTFNGGMDPAELVIDGTGTGFVELENAAGTVLAGDLLVTVNNTAGSTDFGALRLRETWSGPGGITKNGAGMAALTGDGKNFDGPIVIVQGVLAFSQPASPTNSAAMTVLPGGQLRLTSANDEFGARIYNFGGGTIRLAGPGRSGVADAASLGVRGAMRYEPGAGTNEAVVINPVELTDDAGVHVAGINVLRFSGPLTGTNALTKSGGGQLVLGSGAGGFRGAIEVETGSLRLEGTDLGDNTGRLTLAPSTTLAGAGRWGGELRLQNGAVLAVDLGDTPGAAPPLRVGALQVNGTGVLDITWPDGLDPGQYAVLAVDDAATGQWTLATVPEDYPDASVEFAEGIFYVVLGGTPPNPLDEWLDLYGLTGDDALDLADPDGDGIPNILERALGLSPVQADAGVPVTFGVEEDKFAITYPVARGQSDLQVLPETIADFAPESSWTGIEAQLVDDSEESRAWYRAEIPFEDPSGYLRLRVIRSEP